MDRQFLLEQVHYFVPCFAILFIAFLSLFPGTDETLRGQLRAWLLGLMTGSFAKRCLVMTVVVAVIGTWMVVEWKIALEKHNDEKFANEQAVTKAAALRSAQILEFLSKNPPPLDGLALFYKFVERFGSRDGGKIDEVRLKLDAIGLQSDELDRLCEWNQMMNGSSVRTNLHKIAVELKSLSETPLK